MTGWNVAEKIKILKAGMLSVACIAVVCSSALADQKRKSKNNSVVDQLKLVPGDEKGNELKALKTELLVSKSEKLAILQLQKLLKRYKGTEMEPDIWFRMAELYMRRAKTERFFELNRDSKMILSFVPKIVSNASEKREIAQAVSIYDRLQHDFPQFESMDMVIFNDAFARQQLGQSTDAESLYQHLVSRFPQSPLAADSELAMGEINYERKNFKLALEHFLNIRKYPQSRAYPYGLYKAAWAYYNMQQNRDALAQLEQVVAYGKKVRDLQLDQKLDLRKEALNDMTIFFEETNPSSHALDYFTAQSGELPVEPTLLKLGRLYHHHSRYDDVNVVFTDFIHKFPHSPFLRIVYNELVESHEDHHDRDNAVAVMLKMKQLCEDTRPALAATPKQGSKPAPDKIVTSDDKSCDELLYDTSHHLAAKWHSMWLKNKNFPILANSAQKAYEVELSLPVSDKEEADNTRYEYAELLFQREMYRPASEQYAKVAASTRVPKLRHDSNHAALVALEKAVGDKWSESDETRFKSLAEMYRKNNPSGPFLLDIDFKVGFIAYQKNHYDEAAPIFQRLGWKYGNTEKGRKAQDLYLDILNIKKDYAQLRQRSKELLDMGGADENRKLGLGKIYREAYFAEIQGLEEKGQLDKAIHEYKTFAATNPNTDLAQKALWNAIQLQYKNKDLKGATESSYQYWKKYPTAPNSKDALLQAAQGFEAMAQLSSAAQVLEDLARADSKNAEKWQSVSADFYALSGNETKAANLYKQLAGSKDKHVAQAAVEKWEELEESKNGSGLKEVQRLILEKNVQPQASLALLKRVENLYDEKKYTEAFNDAKKIISMEGASRYAQAQARFIQAEVLEQEFRSQSVKSRLDRIAMVLAMKTEKLDKAQRAFQGAIKYGDPKVALQAMKHLAGCYEHYAKAVRSIELPAGTPAADAEAFKKQVDELAVPMEEKSVDTLVEAVKQAKKLQLRDGSVAEMQMELNRLNQRASNDTQVALKAPPMMVPTFSPGAGL